MHDDRRKEILGNYGARPKTAEILDLLNWYAQSLQEPSDWPQQRKDFSDLQGAIIRHMQTQDMAMDEVCQAARALMGRFPQHVISKYE